MKKFWYKFNIENLKDIQHEVMNYFNNHTVEKFHTEHETFIHVEFDKFPTLKKFIEPRVVTAINETSICVVPPRTKTNIHIDGQRIDPTKLWESRIQDLQPNHEWLTNSAPIANQWVLIIPIQNSEKSINYWYNNDDVSADDEYVYEHNRDQYPYKFYISFVKDNVTLTPIATTVIDAATIIKSDEYHNVDNTQSDDRRYVFIIRFRESEPYKTPDRVFNFKDLEING